MGYVYAIQFDDLAVKVGQAIDPVKRIATHQREAARFGRRVVQIWSASVNRAGAVEDRLIAYCASHGTARPGTREYFTGVPWDSRTWDEVVRGTPPAWDTSRCPGTELVPADCPTGQNAGTEWVEGVLSQLGQEGGTELVPGDRPPLSLRDAGQVTWGPGEWETYAI